MVNDKDIKIGMQTVGADAAAREIDKVPDAIKEIPASTPDATKSIDDVSESLQRMADEARRAQDELDLIEAKRRQTARESKGGLLGVDVSKGLDKAGQQVADNTGFGQEYRAVSAMIGADAVAIAGSVAAIGAATVAGYKMLTGTVDGYKQLMEDAAAQGRSLGPEIEDQIQALEDTLSPVAGLFDAIAEKAAAVWEVIKNPVDTLSGLGALRESLEREAKAFAQLQEMRKDIATSKVADIEGIYQREANKLKEQEDTMRRIIQLRQEISSIEQQRANNQVRIAKQDGGDVALAEANALAVELRVKQQQLVEDLRQAQADQKQLVENFRAADLAYRTAINEGLDKVNPEKFSELSRAYDAAQEAVNKGKETLPLIEQKFRDAQVAVAEDVEIKLNDLRDKYSAGLSQQAGAAFNSVTEAVRTSLTTGPEAAISEIRMAVAADRIQTVQAIQTLAPQPQDKAAVVQAVQGVGKSIADQGNATIAALAAISAGIGQITGRINAQQRQINQLFARSR